jgi:hypothetical protein
MSKVEDNLFLATKLYHKKLPKDVLSEIQKLLRVNKFLYVEIDINNKVRTICNDICWMENSISKNYHKVHNCFVKSKNIRSGFSFRVNIDDCPDSQFPRIEDAWANYGWRNNFCVIQKNPQEDYSFLGFGSSMESDNLFSNVLNNYEYTKILIEQLITSMKHFYSKYLPEPLVDLCDIKDNTEQKGLIFHHQNRNDDLELLAKLGYADELLFLTSINLSNEDVSLLRKYYLYPDQTNDTDLQKLKYKLKCSKENPLEEKIELLKILNKF